MLLARFLTITTVVLGGLLAGARSAEAQNIAYQGFETNTGDWTTPITRVASGGGVLGVPSFQGSHHAELTNVPDTYQAGFGYGNFTRFDHPFPNVLPYTGPYVVSLSMYVSANTPSSGGDPGIWIDVSPRDTDTGFSNFDGEHNFRLTSTGTQVDVRVDGQLTPIATITTSGWYTFGIGYRKGSTSSSPVTSDMTVVGPSGALLGSTTVSQWVGANVAAYFPTPAPDLSSGNLGGASYSWVTVWKNGWNQDVVAIDAVRIDQEVSSAFQVKYSSNLTRGDSVINITNTGVNGNSLFGPGFGGGAGNLCINAYAFSPDEQLVSCCSCLVTPNGLVHLTANNDMVSNTLTGIRPDSIVVKLVASAAGPNFAGSSCSNSAALVDYGGSFPLANGMLAWGTTLHSASNDDPPPVGSPFSITETPFLPATLNASELASIKNRCINIIGNGSTYGQCRSCRLGGLGGSKQ